MTSLAVGLVDLRRALKAVTPHAEPDHEITRLHRVRCDVGPVNLTVTATQHYTVGNAIVSVVGDVLGELIEFDLLPSEVKHILSVFPMPKKRPGIDPMDHVLRIELDEKLITITDIDGLFAGTSLSLPRTPVETDYPDVQGLLAKRLTARPVKTDRLVTGGQLLVLFNHAASAYHEALVIEPTGSRSSLLVSCGDSFIGLLMPVPADDDRTALINGWHADWLARLGVADAGYQPRKQD